MGDKIGQIRHRIEGISNCLLCVVESGAPDVAKMRSDEYFHLALEQIAAELETIEKELLKGATHESL